MGKNKVSRNPALVYFHPARSALNMEVRQHPGLVELLQQYKADDFPGIIGEVAAYCNIVMDGVYSEEDLDKLCGILYAKLQAMRKVIIH